MSQSLSGSGEESNGGAAGGAAAGSGAGAAAAGGGTGRPEGCDVGRMVDSSQADDRKMIRLVRERRLLYARNNMPVASFHSQVKRLWQQVADEMGWTVADVRRKWSHIRNSYSRHLRNEMHGARTARGRTVSRWYLADELDFLREHMATDTRPSYSNTYAPTFLEMDLSEQPAAQSADHVDIKPFIQNPWFSLSTSHMNASLEPKTEPYNHNEDSASSAFEPDENSSYFQFFRGIHNDYLELTPKSRRLFKRQCLSFLHGLLDLQENQNTNNYDQSDAMNLSNSVNLSDEEPERKVCVVNNADNYSILPNN
ncbi:uncharacterized protein LOC113512729 isoform X2 [Galleria mellonella]|uniref:Uncharacterized protein LOC113512729 isoform X2 n=1 Tax=Galleria mellonella TaxID=7137 RepID=A0ABM3MIC5_GALME|nr:uncharacterized protein LOC113512729 isoform X2 [Galleria mellonella]